VLAHDTARSLDGGGPAGDPRPCPLCGGVGLPKWSAQDGNRRVTEKRFSYLDCQTCHTTYIRVIPLDLDRYYRHGYHRLPATKSELRDLANPERFKLDALRGLPHGGRVLDVGSSFGAFAFLAHEAGLYVEVVEPDPACRTILTTMLGLHAYDDIHTADIDDPGGYDAITLWQVFEHVPDPIAMLARVFALLRPGGIAIVATPNPESLQARLFKARWAHVDAPRHLQLVPTSALIDRAIEIGFELDFITFADRGSLGWNSFGWETSMANMATRPALSQALGVIGRAIGMLVRLFERTGDRGASYTATLRRPI
jgi:2-polyprenyl-3-methyl-5-hydroxy-6-metoxy-1,4-benzoquinol methylase